jgi:hypothetical protein
VLSAPPHAHAYARGGLQTVKYAARLHRPAALGDCVHRELDPEIYSLRDDIADRARMKVAEVVMG